MESVVHRSVEILRYTNSADQTRLQYLLAEKKIVTVIDTFQEQLREIFIFRHPELYQKKEEQQTAFEQHVHELEKQQPLSEQGVWAYFPWNATVVHLLDNDDFQTLRTARNRNLITPSEQERFYHSRIGVAGLSVGNSVVMAIILTGGAGHIKIADHDTLEVSNMNRIRASVTALGLGKTTMTGRQILEQNPYAQIDYFDEGITEENLNIFLEGLDVVIDEMDNLEMKIRLRQEAKKRRLPVVMATDNGDHGLVDVERYDLHPDLPVYHNRIPDVEAKVLGQKLTLLERGRLITQHVDPANVALRMQQSLLQIGRTLVTYPQLGTAATLNGVLVAYVVRRIVNKLPVIDNRAVLNLDALLDARYDQLAARHEREEHLNLFRKALQL